MDENKKDIYIHYSSCLDEEAIVGDGTKIWHFSHIQKGAIIGRDCVIGQNVNIGPDVIIGDRVKIQNNVSVYSGVIIEDDVFIGPSVVFTNVINPRSFINRKSEFKTTLIRRGASIGANSTIICGKTIEEYALIGAGSVVTKNVEAYNLVYGNPALVKGKVNREGNKI
jgi:UDP-2-acetamido-3-amino-2,3-dideoxy-glucuronate N-acetyltransferase